MRKSTQKLGMINHLLLYYKTSSLLIYVRIDVVILEVKEKEIAY